ncbi:MAG: ZIP family metal transporter [Nitrososphaerales archaeon]
MDQLQLGILASLIVGATTGFGGLPVLFMKNLNQRVLDTLLGFAAGVMLAATAFSLLIPAIEYGGVLQATPAFIIGATAIYLIDKYVPHEHIFKGHEGPPSTRLSGTSLMIIAITIHNFPEGLAVGVSFGGEDLTAALTIAFAIALQNIPEGSAVAFPLVRAGFRRRKAAFYALLTGLLEPVGGVIGVSIVTLSTHMLPTALSFAGGAMAFVVSHEMIPESHRFGHEKEATFGFVAGFALMMLLDNAFA